VREERDRKKGRQENNTKRVKEKWNDNRARKKEIHRQTDIKI
jgi:hypothetical protein